MATDNVQHGIDDEPTGDAEKGAKLGGVGGAVTGAAAGAMLGPVGALVGAAVGAVAGAVGSGVAVAAVDRIDNDNTISGIGGGATPDTGNLASSAAHSVGNTAGNVAHGAANAVGNAGQAVANTATNVGNSASHAANSGLGTGVSQEAPLGETTPSLKTGGHANDGTSDTRGVGEKLADAVTGDATDDKTGKTVDHR